MALATKKRPTGTTHRKRTGTHHKHSKSYLKTYWPYVPMLMIVGLGLVVNAVWSHSAVLGTQSDFSATSLLDDTNQQRLTHWESALAIDQQLSDAAQAKANDMVTNNYWAHTAPDGKTPWSFITGSGYSYQTAGENLAYGFSSASGVVSGWMNSREHRDNILDARYQNVGFGVASSPNFQGHGPTTVVAAEYAQPVSTATALDSTKVSPTTREVAAQPVSRIQVLTGGQAAWSLALLSALTGAAVALFVLRHGFRLHRALNRGEMFVAHHPYIDIAIVFVITAGILLTRTGGIIR